MDDIPVPPFAGFAAAQRFHRLLLLYLRQVKYPGELVGLHQFLLGQALYWHAPRGGAACAQCRPPDHTYACRQAGDQPDGGRACGQCGPPYPCRTVLSVATVARFPSPWTPVGLAAAMKAVGLLPADDDHRDDPAAATLRWGGDGWTDPRTSATREADGRWVVRTRERSDQRMQRFADDKAFCDYLCDQALVHAFLYGWQVDPQWIEMVRPGVARIRSWWAEQVRLPYLDNERAAGSP